MLKGGRVEQIRYLQGTDIVGYETGLHLKATNLISRTLGLRKQTGKKQTLAIKRPKGAEINVN